MNVELSNLSRTNSK